MGPAPLDLPDPLHAKPLASAGAADDLLSQMAGEEIDRLLAQAEQATDAAVDDGEAADAQGVETPLPVVGKEPGKPANEPAPTPSMPAVSLPNPPNSPPPGAEVERRETAVSSFVAEGDPALEAELDNLLATLNAAPIATSAPGTVVPPEGKPAPAAEQETPAPEAPAPGAQTAAPRDPAAPGANTDAVLTGEMDRVFDKMTATAEPAPAIDGPTTDEPATPAGSIDLLKVLDPIVASDAAKAEEEAATGQTPSDLTDEQVEPAQDRVPIYLLILEWVNAPLRWLSPAVRDAAGKIGILTLINAAAVFLYVLFFRRK